MRYLGLDLGTKTLGISISDDTKTIASSLTTLRFKESYTEIYKELKEIISKYNIEKIILGFPKNMNNSIGEKGEMVLAFKKNLEEMFNICVILEDERLTTRIAENVLINADMSRKKRKKVIDKVASSVILQSYLDKEGRK